MTPPTRRLGATLVVSLATAALSFSTLVTPADAAPAKDYERVIVRFKATVDGCKVSAKGGTQWRVLAKLDNKANKPVASRTLFVSVVKPSGDFGARVDTGVVRGGAVSKVVSLRVPNNPGVKVDFGVGTGAMGDGKQFRAARLNDC